MAIASCTGKRENSEANEVMEEDVTFGSGTLSTAIQAMATPLPQRTQKTSKRSY